MIEFERAEYQVSRFIERIGRAMAIDKPGALESAGCILNQ